MELQISVHTSELEHELTLLNELIEKIKEVDLLLNEISKIRDDIELNISFISKS